MRIGFFTDLHANPAALHAILNKLEQHSCDYIVFGGDAVGKGPFPNETVLMLKAAGVDCVIGNHDINTLSFYRGIPVGEPSFSQHRQWTADQLSTEAVEFMETWVPNIRLAVDGTVISFSHCGTDSYPSETSKLRSLKGIHVPELRTQRTKKAFRHLPGDLMLFGHHHKQTYVQDNERRYCNPGPAGCGEFSVANYLLVDTRSGELPRVRFKRANYDATEITSALRNSDIPLAQELVTRDMRLLPPEIRLKPTEHVKTLERTIELIEPYAMSPYETN